MKAKLTLSRRALFGTSAAVAATGTLAACGASTSGGGDFAMISTQFTPVEEKQRFEEILSEHVSTTSVSYTTMTAPEMLTQVTSQVGSGNLQFGLIGGLHGDLQPLAENLEDIDEALVETARAAGIAEDLLELGKLGGETTKYIPWMQASYVMAVNKKALEWLPEGADVNALTYEQVLEWATAANEANGSPVFGFPAGPKGLYHRFFQGFQLPSFTGGVITTFQSPEAIESWQWMKDFWAQCNPSSTNYDFMQEPLASGEVLVAWDHVARLVGAPQDNPDDWVMVPSPTGPQGLGYMLVIGGLAIPKGGDVETAAQVIEEFLKPEMQIATLEKNAFFPVVEAEIPSELPPAIQLEFDAVNAQQGADGAIVALPPVGLGEQDGELSQVFKDCFAEICLDGGDPGTVIPGKAEQVQTLLDTAEASCWDPDPAGDGVCQVG
ncbi:ABC transporter substrate-binding protein [Brachybacterium sp. p3-SID1565]|uniref:Carbohydrate ABC transporter substrate-binding protein n=1 Tax=Brachybacterium epidermidis TaxID=2781983 RepID=A0ABR9W1G4_9MICO|nr:MULTISPECIES: ABC transporter substrate-binding protein [Brachybacterium]MBE9403168.1 carbohydrate ABC transporter substrate-binding protein [Brachybacterium epidermidis]MCT1385749.1 ABC transporter substrate-binding protein [Brachybacterium sp. p3-SID1565]